MLFELAAGVTPRRLFSFWRMRNSDHQSDSAKHRPSTS